MSLYGALFSGVSGLSSQSSAMGAISDNISNVNTIGYKGTQVNFQTLITQQTSLTEYSPGGVQSKPRGGIDVQGLLQATTSSTDVALSGSGFFVVNSTAMPSTEGGTFAYTRAGSFKPDQYGYLKNASGFYMQGWPLVPNDGSSAATPGSVTINSTSYMKAYKNADGTYHYINQNTVSSSELQPLNVNTIGGTAQATSSVAMGANLPSGDPIYSASNPSAGGLHTTNVQLYDSLGNPGNAQFTWTKTASNAWQLQATPPSGAAVLNLDNYSTPLGVPTSLTYASQGQLEFASVPPAGSYFSISSMVGTTLKYVQVQFYNSSAAGASGLDPTTDNPLDLTGVNAAGSQNEPYVLGVNLSGISDSASVATALTNAIQSAINQPSLKNTYNMAGVLNGGMADGANRFSASSNTMQIIQEPGAQALNFNVIANATTGLGSSIVQSGTGVGSGANTTNPSTMGQFTVKAVAAGYVDTTNGAYKTNNLTINAVNAGTANGTNKFTLNSLPTTSHLVVGGVDLGTWTAIGGATTTAMATAGAAAINANATLTAMGVTAVAAGSSITLTTTSGPVTAIPNAGGAATDVTWTNGASGTSTESVPTSADVLQIGNIQIPWSQIVAGQVTSYTDTTTGAVHNGATAPAFTAVTLPHGASGTDATALAATDMTKMTANLAYLLNPTAGAGGIFDTAVATNPTNPGIASAKVDPNKSTQLDLTSGNTPITLMVNNADVTWANGKVGNAGPQVMGEVGQYSSTTGAAVTFNGDGTPATVIPNAMELYWANGAEDQHGNKGSSTVKPQVSLDLGDLNQSNGLTQLGGNYQVSYMTQNGAKFGNFSGISVGSNGIVTALFDNGVRSPVFQIPITTFANPDGLQALTGNVWIETSYSGAYTVRAPGEAGSGTVQQSSLESSTVDIGTEFTSMITVQNAYSAAAKVITTTDQLLTQLINIKQ